ncbi:MAG: hypothetical protein Q4D34_06420 [Eggerthellaceae bacterium]|nr:hypothetical protein [Eggerthellaceae bacterium]
MSGIVQDENGVYRWVYEFNLYKNPTILFTVMKILVGIIVIGLVIMLAFMVPDLAKGYADSGDVAETLTFGGIFIALFIVLTVVGYLVYAIMQGGKYCVVFTMDEEGITHKQLPRQYKKAQIVGALNVLAGLAGGNVTQAGIGLITSTRDSISSEFASVRSVKGSRALRVIKVNEPLAKNQVYVEADDYDFVFGFIRDHCPNARIKG